MQNAVLREISSLPSPRGLPLIGHALALDESRFHLVLEDWARELGEFYVFRIVRKPFVVVSNAEVIQKILRDRPQGFTRGARLHEILDEIGVSGVFTAEHERWTRQRKLVMAAFNATHVRAFHDPVMAITDRLLGVWQRAASEGRSVDALADLMRYTVDVTTTVAFGRDMNTLEQGEGELQQHLARFFATVNHRLRAPFPYWRYLPRARDRAFERSRAQVEQVVFEIIRNARTALEREPTRAASPSNLLEAMLVARDADDPKARLDDDEIYGNVLTLLLAGEDTTALTIAWMLYYMAKQPEVVERMRAELDTKLLRVGGMPETPEQVRELEYVGAVVQETLRLRGAAPLMFMEPMHDVVLGDLAVPAGTLIVVLTRAAANKDEHFSAPDRFEPERWLGRRADLPHHDARAAMPFGTGPRICPGRALALLECSMVAAMVVQHFDIALAEPERPVAERFDFTMRPDALNIRLSARRSPQ